MADNDRQRTRIANKFHWQWLIYISWFFLSIFYSFPPWYSMTPAGGSMAQFYMYMSVYVYTYTLTVKHNRNTFSFLFNRKTESKSKNTLWNGNICYNTWTFKSLFLLNNTYFCLNVWIYYKCTWFFFDVYFQMSIRR